ncbi:9417_t:CDS:10 [Paraglomus brasilianum]|uniref:9417_t:CDS:1 n=1 Tax=Paraglomus brasilianum TaxID=144538 RepID=A0A9N8ZJ16_9GLOM|nr:9417_t:CDS:10 [Paraglomus brasilianum]
MDMSWIHVLPPALTACISSLILTIQLRKQHTFDSILLSGDSPDAGVRFSTVKRDTTVVAVTTLQSALFAFLVGFRLGATLDGEVRLNPKYAGVLAICWFYALVLALLALRPKGRKWAWTLNGHLTAFFAVSCLSSVWQLRVTYIETTDTDFLERLFATLNVILSFTSLSITITTPKGPPLYCDGRPVTGSSYCSLWDFITFSYVSSLLKTAYLQDTLDDSDLYQLPYSYRAFTLYHNIKKWRGSHLFIRLWHANKKLILLQLLFTATGAMLYYMPIFFFLRFLEFFEEYPTYDNSLERGYLYAIGMLLTNILLQVNVAQLWYWSSSALQISVKSMLNAEIYSKSLKRRNVSGATLETDDDDDSEVIEDADVDNSTKIIDKEATLGKITNLMAVDTNRVAEFCTWWISVVDSPIEIIVGTYFLYQLLGSACLFGLLVMIFTLPVNHYTAKHYAKTQDRLMKARDRRINLMNEVLQAIRIIKIFAWETSWEDKILVLRDVELKELRNNFIYLTMFDLLWMASPILVAVVSFFWYTKIQSNPLTTSVAFASIAVFNELRFALNILPEAVMEALQAYVSLNRIEKFLKEDEIKPPTDEDLENFDRIAFVDATVKWNQSENKAVSNGDLRNEFIMTELNLEFPVRELSIICGPTGSGKTLLLMSLLGETERVTGNIYCPRSPVDNTILSDNITPENWIIENGVALVAQQSWLQNASIRDNILFGLPYHEARYVQVVKMCALEKDLEMFEDGDLTEIGEKGLTLSGGQKQRVALARAVYSRARHILLDDVLSAVDAHTAMHLMSECIMGSLMTDRTRIIVTHHVNLCLPSASYLVAVRDGSVHHCGDIDNLRESGKLAEIIEEVEENAEVKATVIDLELSDDIDKTLSHEQINGDISSSQTNKKKSTGPKILVEKEARATGAVRFKIYKTYITTTGHIIFWSIVALLFVATRSSQILESWWLKVWTGDTEQPKSFGSLSISMRQVDWALFEQIHIGSELNIERTNHDLTYYLTIYTLITLASVVFGIARFAVLYYGSLKTSRLLYKKLLKRIMRAPLRFFDTTPVGRILNRFSKDFETIDGNIIGDLAWFMNNTLMMVTTAMVITAITKEFIIAAVIFGIIFMVVGALFTRASRELKRMDSVTRSPLYTHFTETLAGVTTIRAFGATKRFMEEMLTRIDNNARPFFFVWLINRWLSMRFNVTGSFVSFIAAIFLLWNIDSVDAGLAGLSLSFAMNFTEQLMWAVRRYTTLEMSMNAMERVDEFSEIAQEPPEIVHPRPSAGWPYEGAITVEDLEVKYAPDLEPVLHGISFEVGGGEKVGIVGRTGSGKSTIALAFFRFVDTSAGRITIDEIDIASIGVHDLRSRMTIIPQDPTLFTGTIRSNLDPFDEHSEHAIREALERVQLLPSAGEITEDSTAFASASVFQSLETPVSEGGKNFSQGQRQLLCLARALLRRSKIILMDEATASVDFGTDEKIQEAIRSEFVDSTILCIAHRLRTVIDYDKILVLDQGKILEYDSPYNLITNSQSAFYKMCKNSGEYELLLSNTKGGQVSEAEENTNS